MEQIQRKPLKRLIKMQNKMMRSIPMMQIKLKPTKMNRKTLKTKITITT